MQSFLHRAGEIVGRLGFVNGSLYAISRGLASCSSGRWRVVKYYFVAQPVTVSSRAVDSGAISIAQISPEDSIVRQFPRSADIIRRRFDDGAICLVARKGNEFVGYLWLKLRGYEEDEVRCRYVPIPELRTAWDFDVYVAPSYRMSRTFTRLWDAANDFLRNNRIDWTLSRISAYNTDSLRAHGRMGGERIATALFLCLGAMQVAFISIRPFVYVSLSDSARPILRLKVPVGGADRKGV